MKKKILALCLVIVLVVTAITGVTLAYFTDTDTVENTFTMGKVDILLDEAPVNDDGKKVSGDRVKENDYTKTNMVPGHVFDKDPTIHVVKGSEESYIFLDLTINKYNSLFWVMAADATEDKIIAPLYVEDDEGKLLLTNVYAKAVDGKPVFSTTKFIDYMLAEKTAFQNMINKWFTGIKHENWEICDIFVGVDKDDVNKKGDYMTIRFAYQGDTDGNVNTVNAKKSAEDLNIQFMESFQMPKTVTQKMISDGKDLGGMKNSFNTDKKAFCMNFKAYAIQADELPTLNDAYKAMFGIEKGATLQ